VKPGNSRVEKPGLSGISGVSGLFPGVSGVHTATLSHKCSVSPLLIISHFHTLLPIQMVRVKVRRETEEPSTQRRTKARHDPAALQAVQEALGQEASQRSSRPRQGDPPPSYAERSEEEIYEEEEERTESDDEVEDETYEQSPEPPHRHGKGLAKKNPATSPIPKRAIKPHMSIKAVQLLEFLLNTNKE
jgi:hypothetical protein